jgi:WD40 repeat protein
LLLRLTGVSARRKYFQFDYNSQYLASASNDGSILVWSTDNFNLAPYKLTDNTAWVMLLKFVNNGNDLIAAYADGKIRKWPIVYTEMTEKVKQKIDRNFTIEEWQQFVAKDIDYQKTINELP